MSAHQFAHLTETCIITSTDLNTQHCTTIKGVHVSNQKLKHIGSPQDSIKYYGLITPKDKIWCWFVGGDDLTGALHDLQLQLSPPLPPSFASINTG